MASSRRFSFSPGNIFGDQIDVDPEALSRRGRENVPKRRLSLNVPFFGNRRRSVAVSEAFQSPTVGPSLTRRLSTRLSRALSNKSSSKPSTPIGNRLSRTFSRGSSKPSTPIGTRLSRTFSFKDPPKPELPAFLTSQDGRINLKNEAEKLFLAASNARLPPVPDSPTSTPEYITPRAADGSYFTPKHDWSTAHSPTASTIVEDTLYESDEGEVPQPYELLPPSTIVRNNVQAETGLDLHQIAASTHSATRKSKRVTFLGDHTHQHERPTASPELDLMHLTPSMNLRRRTELDSAAKSDLFSTHMVGQSSNNTMAVAGPLSQLHKSSSAFSLYSGFEDLLGGDDSNLSTLTQYYMSTSERNEIDVDMKSHNDANVAHQSMLGDRAARIKLVLNRSNTATGSASPAEVDLEVERPSSAIPSSGVLSPSELHIIFEPRTIRSSSPNSQIQSHHNDIPPLTLPPPLYTSNTTPNTIRPRTQQRHYPPQAQRMFAGNPNTPRPGSPHPVYHDQSAASSASRQTRSSNRSNTIVTNDRTAHASSHTATPTLTGRSRPFVQGTIADPFTIPPSSAANSASKEQTRSIKFSERQNKPERPMFPQSEDPSGIKGPLNLSDSASVGGVMPAPMPRDTRSGSVQTANGQSTAAASFPLSSSRNVTSGHGDGEEVGEAGLKKDGAWLKRLQARLSGIHPAIWAEVAVTMDGSVEDVVEPLLRGRFDTVNMAEAMIHSDLKVLLDVYRRWVLTQQGVLLHKDVLAAVMTEEIWSCCHEWHNDEAAQQRPSVALALPTLQQCLVAVAQLSARAAADRLGRNGGNEHIRRATKLETPPESNGMENSGRSPSVCLIHCFQEREELTLSQNMHATAGLQGIPHLRALLRAALYEAHMQRVTARGDRELPDYLVLPLQQQRAIDIFDMGESPSAEEKTQGTVRELWELRAGLTRRPMHWVPSTWYKEMAQVHKLKMIGRAISHDLAM